MIKKTDFINVLFEANSMKVGGSGLQASDLLNFMNIFATSFEEVVSYVDFMKLLYKVGDNMGGS